MGHRATLRQAVQPGRRSRVLWLSAETPAVTGGGGERRQYHQIAALVAQGIDVEVAALRSPQDHASIDKIVPVERFGPGGRRSSELDRLIQAGFDAAVVAHVESVPLVAGALGRAGIPWLVDFHNVYSRWHARRGEAKAAWAWRRRERHALRVASAASACSTEEADSLIRLGAGGERVIVAGNGVAPDEWPDDALGEHRSPVVAFFGSFAHQPNRHGLEWFASHVWPAVRAARPDATLVLVGPGEPPAAALTVPGATHLGRVDDLAAFLGGVRVVVVPIVEGVGSRVKFGEALASGAAVVSTSVGAEGFDAAGAFIEAEEPQAFADATVALLGDEAAAAALGAAGRALAFDRFSWSRTTAPIGAWLEDAR